MSTLDDAIRVIARERDAYLAAGATPGGAAQLDAKVQALAHEKKRATATRGDA